jgi:hypothetical protein
MQSEISGQSEKVQGRESAPRGEESGLGKEKERRLDREREREREKERERESSLG